MYCKYENLYYLLNNHLQTILELYILGKKTYKKGNVLYFPKDYRDIILFFV